VGVNGITEQDPSLKAFKDGVTDLHLLRPGLLVAALGLLVAALLLWIGQPGPSQQAWRWQLAQSTALAQAATLRQAFAQINAETQAAAADPALIAAVQSGDSARLRNAEAGLHYRDAVVDAFVTPLGQGEPTADRAAPFTFAALDLLRRSESGSPPPLEAQRAGDRWLVYSAAAIRSPGSQQAAGTVLLAVDLQRALRGLPSLPPEAGELVFEQRFGDGPVQVLYKTGTPGSARPYALDLGNPHWNARFTPGSAYDAPMPWVSIALALAALLIAAGAFWVAMLSVVRGLRGRLKSDAQQLNQLVEELSGGKAVKAFSLSLAELNGLAQALARFSLRDRQTNPGAPLAPESNGITTRSAPAANPARSTRQEGARPPFKETDVFGVGILDADQDFLRMEHPPAMNSIAQVPPQVPASIFRAYDIRGIVPDTLTAETAYWIGRAIGSQSLAQGEPHVSVGRDGRLSGPELVQQLIQGVADSGCQVTDVGMVPTGALYFAAAIDLDSLDSEIKARPGSGVMLTGSHNPANYNGFKIIIAGDTLANEQIQKLYERIRDNDLASGQGSIKKVDILKSYNAYIQKDIAVPRRLKVVVDCGNGVGGVIAPQLIEQLNCEVIPLFCEVDGNFPNHHPDPGKLENLEDLIAKVKETGADLGLAFDGDADRVGVVTNEGNVVFPDRLLMLFAQDVLSRNPGADIIYDVKCSRNLKKLIEDHKGRPVMYKTGHSLIKKKMKETGALLAGEMSGHVFFKERWFGFDDGIYGAALEILSQKSETAEAVFAKFPNDVSTPEINIKVTEETKFSIIEALVSDAQWGDASLNKIDGVRVDYRNGWGLVRASNTTPVLVLRFEAEDDAELERIKAVFRDQLKRVAPDLTIPF
jgi:phosphomannomutase/phosphoglucomutase